MSFHNIIADVSIITHTRLITTDPSFRTSFPHTHARTPSPLQAVYLDPALPGPGEELPLHVLSAHRRALLRLVEPADLPGLLGCA